MSGYRIRYQTIEIGDLDVHLRTLRDLNQYADAHGDAARAGISPATWPLFGVVWDSSQVLARLMLDFDVAGLRILEVGCGIGLPSLVLCQRRADITATDHHPEVAPFLEKNARLNGLEPIPCVRSDWHTADDRLGCFDLIIGSDLVYQPGHGALLSGFINRHARDRCEVIIVGPGRREQAPFNQCMTGLGYRHTSTAASLDNAFDPSFAPRIHRYRRTSTIGPRALA